MKKQLLATAIATAVFITACGDDGATDTAAQTQAVKLETNAQKFSYGLGKSVVDYYKTNNIEIDRAAFMAGFNDVLDGKDPRISEEELRTAAEEYGKEIQAKIEAEAKAASEKAKAENAAYLEANGKKEGVVTTDSGLQYKVISKSDSGVKVAAGATVVVHYVGKLIDGSEFDSSVARNEPLTIAVNQLIPGWKEGLKLMEVGDKYELVVPYELAYGDRGVGNIPPYATLIFEVELLEVKASNAPQPAANAQSAGSAEVNELTGEQLQGQ